MELGRAFLWLWPMAFGCAGRTVAGHVMIGGGEEMLPSETYKTYISHRIAAELASYFSPAYIRDIP